MFANNFTQQIWPFFNRDIYFKTDPNATIGTLFIKTVFLSCAVFFTLNFALILIQNIHKGSRKRLKITLIGFSLHFLIINLPVLAISCIFSTFWIHFLNLSHLFVLVQLFHVLFLMFMENFNI
jgi:hypothetical protein